MAQILVVDDSTTMRQMVTFTLTSAGHEVVEAPDGNKALVVAKQRKFDLVITDVNMPGMNGIDLVKALRDLKTYKTIPILILARDASDVNIKKAETLGASGFIEKPFTPERLLSVVNQVLVDAYVN